MELDDDIYKRVELLSQEGNDLADSDDFHGAIGKWRMALELLPTPKDEWEAATWLFASIGEAHYHQGEHPLAKEALYDALNCPGGQANPFIQYVLGKTLVRMNDGKGIDHLLKTYMLDGNDIFDADEADGQASLQILRDRKLI